MATQVNEEIKEFIFNLIKQDSMLKMLDHISLLKILNTFVTRLQDNNITINAQDKNNPEVKEALQLGYRAEAAQMLDPSLKVDMKPILKPLAKKEKEETEEEKEENREKNIFKLLKRKLELTLTKQNKNPTKEQQEALEAKLKELAKKFAKGKGGQIMLTGCIDTMIAESIERKSLYGGIDPEKGSGQERAAVLGIQGGNQFARQDLSNIGDTAMARSNQPDSGQPDFVPSRISSAVNMLANDIPAASEPELAANSPFKLPGIPQNKPPGT